MMHHEVGGIMAEHKSAMKRHRQSIKRTERNKHYKTQLKTALKRARTALEEKAPDADKLVKEAICTVDKVKGKGVIPANRASRYVSKLAQGLNEK